MKINPDTAERLKQIVSEMGDLLHEAKNICREAMTYDEYDRFRYNCLAHLEPGLLNENPWVTNATTLESIADDAVEDAVEDEEEEEEEEEEELEEEEA